MAQPITTCIPIAIGVPAVEGPNLNNPPNWFDSNISQVITFLDDPRWRGAVRQTFPLMGGAGGVGSGAPEHSAFRALYSPGQSLYLSWLIEINPQTTVSQDVLYVGFSPLPTPANPTPPALVAIITLLNAALIAAAHEHDTPPGNPTPTDIFSITTVTNATGTWGPTNSTPNWIASSGLPGTQDKGTTRVWIAQVLDSKVPAATATKAAWAVQMIVPIGADLLEGQGGPQQKVILDNTFRMWYEMQVQLPPAEGGVGVYSWPDGADFTTAAGVPDPSTWNHFNLDTPAEFIPDCSQGISLDMDHIGTTHLPDFSLIDPNNPNTFFANPLYTNTFNPTPIDVGKITARFRIANWGSQTTSATDIPGLWIDLIDQATGQPTVTNKNPISPTTHLGVGPQPQNSIELSWQPPDPTKYQPPHDHQCILVEITGTGFTFLNQSVVRNMNFIVPQPPAQHIRVRNFDFARLATISVRGLPPLVPHEVAREVLLFVRERNMRPLSAEEKGLPQVVPALHGELKGVGDSNEPQAAAFAQGEPSIGDAIQRYPNLTVYVWHKTGKTVKVAGVEREILHAQGSFGHIFVDDQLSPTASWNHSLQGQGLEQVVPNLYKLSVPSNGETEISTVAHALEHPRSSRNGGFMAQTTNGTKGDFVIIVPLELHGLALCTRLNDTPGLYWVGSPTFATELGHVDAAAIIQSNFGPLGSLEVVARVKDRLFHLSRLNDPGSSWSKPIEFAEGVSGNPTIIQGLFGTHGNFELVVPLASGGLVHYWRDNDEPHPSWKLGAVFGQELGQVGAAALIQSNFEQELGGNLEVVARVGEDLIHLWRDSSPARRWSKPFKFYTGAAGIPGFIQCNFGSRGDFEVVTPLAKGAMAELRRNNDEPATFPWREVTTFGSGQVTAVSLLQSNFTTSSNPAQPGPGDFEVAARVDGRTAHYWHRDESPFTWNGPTAYACS